MCIECVNVFAQRAPDVWVGGGVDGQCWYAGSSGDVGHATVVADVEASGGDVAGCGGQVIFNDEFFVLGCGTFGDRGEPVVAGFAFSWAEHPGDLPSSVSVSIGEGEKLRHRPTLATAATAGVEDHQGMAVSGLNGLWFVVMNLDRDGIADWQSLRADVGGPLIGDVNACGKGRWCRTGINRNYAGFCG